MSRTFDEYCFRKKCEKPYAVNCEPITMADGERKFAYEIEYHRPALDEPFETGGHCGTEDTREQALWHIREWLFRNMIPDSMVEFFGLAREEA